MQMQMLRKLPASWWQLRRHLSSIFRPELALSLPPIDTLRIIVCNRPKAHMYESSVECGRFLQIVATNKQHHLALLDHSQCEPQPLPQKTTSENIVRLSLR